MQMDLKFGGCLGDARTNFRITSGIMSSFPQAKFPILQVVDDATGRTTVAKFVHTETTERYSMIACDAIQMLYEIKPKKLSSLLLFFKADI